MANTQMLRRRIRSVSNTKQITKAMELVAAAKLRRVQSAVTKTRVYKDAASVVLRKLSDSPEAKKHPYFQQPSNPGKLYIIFNSDSGLAGAYNANVFNTAARAITEDNSKGITPKVVAFGRRGARHFSRGSNIELIGDYENIPDVPDINIFAPLLETIADGFTQNQFGSVDIIYTQSISTMVQKVQTINLLPITRQLSETEEDMKKIVYEFEPDIDSVLMAALKVYFEANLRAARIEAAASEHAMRMMSMTSANRNAGELIDSLTLELNATRQAAITQEVAEIIGGAEAIS